MKRVVLVRPQGPRNVGSVLRLAANFGPVELVVAGPTRPSLLLHPDFEQMAHGVPDIAAGVRVVETLEEAIADCTHCYGFTARARDHRELEDWRAARSELVERTADAGERVALVFGSEENGLTGDEIAPLQTLVRFPTADEHTSINLAMSVGVVLSTLHFADAPSARAEATTPLPVADRTFLLERLKDVFGGCAKSEPARRDIVASVERVFARAPLETRDARAWHLLVRAIGGDARPQDYGLEGLASPAPGASRDADATRDTRATSDPGHGA